MTWVPKNRSADDASGKSDDEEDNNNEGDGMSGSMADQSQMYGSYGYGTGGKYFNRFFLPQE